MYFEHEVFFPSLKAWKAAQLSSIFNSCLKTFSWSLKGTKSSQIWILSLHSTLVTYLCLAPKEQACFSEGCLGLGQSASAWNHTKPSACFWGECLNSLFLGIKTALHFSFHCFWQITTCDLPRETNCVTWLCETYELHYWYMCQTCWEAKMKWALPPICY